jgi:RHS repeat-associated protein
MATTTELSENSHQGFEGIKAALCLASMEAKSNNASGMQACLRQNSIGPRSSGKERDETGLDYFGARYYSGAMGRFSSPDSGVDQHPINPQTWNLYSYVRNNPLILVDPDGNYACGKDVSKEDCEKFDEYLKNAKEKIEEAKETGDIEKDQYKLAMKGLNAYGELDDGNNVTVMIGRAAGGFPGSVRAEEGKGIDVTIDAGLFSKGSSLNLFDTIAHEGSHVADAQAWGAAGFTEDARPTKLGTEQAAYSVSTTMFQAHNKMEATAYTPRSNIPIIYWQSNKNPWDNNRMKTNMIKTLYPNWREKAFIANTKGGGGK